MIRYILRRLAWALPTMLIVTFLVYVALRIGTNPVESYKRSNPRVTPEKIQQYIDINGLNPNYVLGYFRWLDNFLTGNWPRSIKGSREVWPALKDAMANTLRLGVAATIVGIFFGLIFGVLASLRPGGKRDIAINTGAFVGISIPPYISAILLQLLFAVYWQRWFGSSLFPTSGVYPAGHTGFDLFLMLKFMALPTIVVAIQIIATYSRYLRSSLLDVLNSDYMRTARSKGISERRVLIHHGMRNALIPIVTLAALDFGSIVGGLIISENIFSYPGMGLYFLKSFGDGDFPLLMPWMVIIVASILVFNLLADISYAWLDPRIRLE